MLENEVFDNLPYYLGVSLYVLYLELVLAIRSGFSFSTYMYVGVFFCAFAFGAFICILVSISNRPKLNKWILFALMELLTFFFLIEFFCNQVYHTFFDLTSIKTGVGGVVTEYMDLVLQVIKNGFGNILLFHIPSFITLFLCIRNKIEIKRSLPFSLGAVFMAAIMFLCSWAGMTWTSFAAEKYTYGYVYYDAVRMFGISHATWLDLRYAGTGVPAPPAEDISIDTADEDDTDRNQLSFDWDSIYESSDPALHRFFDYIRSQKASSKNEYTGIFEGKNLVLIIGESLSKELITEQFFPLTYKMMTEGIVFNDYYQPFWGGSTSTGEASVLTGIIPMDGLNTTQSMIGNDTSFTIASVFNKQLGYPSVMYFGGTDEYYNRIQTHPAMGITEFITDGTGLEDYLYYHYPPSDEELFNFLTDDIQRFDKFFTYILTYSGHGTYSFEDMYHEIGAKNREVLAGTEYYDDWIIGGYIAASYDMEIGLKHFYESLQERGILDDTVFVITADHYPYFLSEAAAYGYPDYLIDLYGFDPANSIERDHNALIIWSPCLEEMDRIIVDDPATSVDIVPTILNRVGIDLDSRIYSGRDVRSEADPIAVWSDSCWKTDKAFYDAATGEYTYTAEEEEPYGYFESVQSAVRNKLFYARNFHKLDLYSYLSPYIQKENVSE